MARTATKKLKCPKCDRTFSMPAHLARHQNAAHGPKRRRKTARPRRVKAVRRTTRRTTAATSAVSVAPNALLREMQAYRDNLVAQRDRLSDQLDAVGRALAALSASPRRPASSARRRGRGRRLRGGSLKHHIERVLRAHGGAMAVKDVTARVVASGFKSKNKTLSKSVGLAMARMPNVARVARGVFRLK